MTPKGDLQRDVILDRIAAHVSEFGWPPTVRELANEVGLNISTVHAHLRRLAYEGRIVRDERKPRALRVIPPDDAA